MKTTTLLMASAIYVLVAALTFAILRWLEYDTELAFLLGAIASTQIAAVIHYRTPGAVNTLQVKLLLGVVLGVTALAFGLVVHLLYAPFTFPDVSIGVATIGTMLTPLVVFNTMWNAMSKTKR